MLKRIVCWLRGHHWKKTRLQPDVMYCRRCPVLLLERPNGEWRSI